VQTQAATETKAAAVPLIRQIESAQAKLAKLHEAATDAAAEAARWQTAFEREPTPEAHQNQAIWSQKAINARSVAGAFERDALEPLIANERKTARDAITREVAAMDARILSEFDSAMTLVAEGIQAMDDAIASLARHHGARVAAQREGAVVHQLSLEQIMRAANSKLSGLRAVDQSSRYAQGEAQAYFAPNGNDATVTLNFIRPAHAVPLALR